jgi:hypothetical protein
MISDAYWKRLLACERRVESVRRCLLQLQTLIKQIQQQLNALTGK